MNLKKALLVFGFPLLIVLVMPLRAQTGCTDSPEDPTIVLGLLGGAGALIAATRTASGDSARHWRSSKRR